MKTLLWRIKHKAKSNDMKIQLAQEKKYIAYMISTFNELRLRDVLMRILESYDYTYKMPFYQFHQHMINMFGSYDSQKVKNV